MCVLTLRNDLHKKNLNKGKRFLRATEVKPTLLKSLLNDIVVISEIINIKSIFGKLKIYMLLTSI